MFVCSVFNIDFEGVKVYVNVNFYIDNNGLDDFVKVIDKGLVVW